MSKIGTIGKILFPGPALAKYILDESSKEGVKIGPFNLRKPSKVTIKDDGTPEYNPLEGIMVKDSPSKAEQIVDNIVSRPKDDKNGYFKYVPGLMGIGGAVLTKSILNALSSEETEEEKRKKTIWGKVLSALGWAGKTGVSAAGGYGMYLLGKKLLEKNSAATSWQPPQTTYRGKRVYYPFSEWPTHAGLEGKAREMYPGTRADGKPEWQDHVYDEDVAKAYDDFWHKADNASMALGGLSAVAGWPVATRARQNVDEILRRYDMSGRPVRTALRDLERAREDLQGSIIPNSEEALRIQSARLRAINDSIRRELSANTPNQAALDRLGNRARPIERIVEDLNRSEQAVGQIRNIEADSNALRAGRRLGWLGNLMRLGGTAEAIRGFIDSTQTTGQDVANKVRSGGYPANPD